ncbi:DUF2569 family protein [Candidatus Woesearchaeota archaeon]|nr:DUF2569 family protein [Candidatus Woesearchaeota archaeon]
MAQENKYYGVKGWLLVLCIILTIIIPLLRSTTLASSLREEVGYPSFHNPQEKALVILDSLLVVALIIFSLYAGLGLWLRRKGAVGIAKAFMLICIAYGLLTLTYPLIGGFSSYTNSALIILLLKQTAYYLAFFGFWYAYLCRSKRVEATYPS